jgi:hypothetical protein
MIRWRSKGKCGWREKSYIDREKNEAQVIEVILLPFFVKNI